MCNYKCSCSIFSGIISIILGIIASFQQINGTIIVTPRILWVVGSISVILLAVSLLASAIQQQCQRCGCTCPAQNTQLIGILGSIFCATVPLAVSIIVTSIVSAIPVNLLVLFFSLMICSVACLIKIYSLLELIFDKGKAHL